MFRVAILSIAFFESTSTDVISMSEALVFDFYRCTVREGLSDTEEEISPPTEALLR